MNETNELKEIDLNTLQKVEVRNHVCPDWVVAYYLNKAEGGNIRAIHEDGAVIRYSQYRPYKEPTKRPMTWIEYKKFKDRNPHTIFRRFGAKNVFVEGIGNSNTEIDYYEYSLDYGETWHKLEVEDD